MYMFFGSFPGLCCMLQLYVAYRLVLHKYGNVSRRIVARTKDKGLERWYRVVTFIRKFL